MQDATARFGSVDWAAQSHAACIVDAAGQITDQFTVDHTALGLTLLVGRFQQARVQRVAVERPDRPVVDALRAADLEVVVVVSRAVKALRTRYGLAGNKADRSDAYVLADCLRTDGHRWPSLQPDSPQTLALRPAVRARKALVATRVATANQLRAHLQIVFPGAMGPFAELDSPIMLRFLERFPSPETAAWLSARRFSAWLQANAYSGRRAAAELLRATRPDCVVLDLVMPVLDGWEFLRAYRWERLSASTSVLVMSVCHSSAEAVRSEFGVEHILIKPFDIDALLEAVKRLLKGSACVRPGLRTQEPKAPPSWSPSSRSSKHDGERQIRRRGRRWSWWQEFH